MNLGTFEIDEQEYKPFFDCVDMEPVSTITMQNIGGNSFMVREGENGEGFVVNDSSKTVWKDTGDVLYIKTCGTVKLNISE